VDGAAVIDLVDELLTAQAVVVGHPLRQVVGPRADAERVHREIRDGLPDRAERRHARCESLGGVFADEQ